MNKTIKDKSGITLIEIVVALIIISIVSLTAYSISMYANKSVVNSRLAIKQSIILSNCSECFKAAVKSIDLSDDEQDYSILLMNKYLDLCQTVGYKHTGVVNGTASFFFDSKFEADTVGRKYQLINKVRSDEVAYTLTITILELRNDETKQCNEITLTVAKT